MTTLSDFDQVLAYHNRTKHSLERYAAGPETLDWTSQPNPFREFSNALRVSLPLIEGHLSPTFGELYQISNVSSQPLNLQNIGILFELSLAISAWKEYGPDRWALRCNPSSGNLHPTEGYLISEGLADLDDGVYHYVSRDHVLEQRFRPSANSDTRTTAKLFIGLSSIHWREAWKYGERAFRYCQHDVGHAIGALRYAAAVLGWSMRIVQNVSSERLAELLGLNRTTDFISAEREEPEILLEVYSRGASQVTPLPHWDQLQGQWYGQANILDPYPMYHWPIIEEVAQATYSPVTAWPIFKDLPAYPPLTHTSITAADILIKQRRSAQHFDGKSTLSTHAFYHILDALLPRPAPPWDVWPSSPRLHLVLFVHRVEELDPGIYVFLRDPQAETRLKAQLSSDFSWSKPQDCPEHLPLFQLIAADCSQAARTFSCHQAIASHGFFSLGMLAEFKTNLQTTAWRYRELFWEAGLIGQVLYLEAEAAGVRGTGIGCYFDDTVHKILGLIGCDFQSLYHFTIGHPLQDSRIMTLPPYPDRT